MYMLRGVQGYVIWDDHRCLPACFVPAQYTGQLCLRMPATLPL